MENQYYLGLDLDDEYAVISFFQLNMKEPETVSTVAGRGGISDTGAARETQENRTVVRR